MSKEHPGIVDSKNIRKESDYNHRKLSEIFKFTNVVAALRFTGNKFEVTRDGCGNILTAKLIPKKKKG